MFFFIKVVVSALVVAGVSELAKRFTLMAAILTALPLTSVLAMIWIYRETGDVQKISDLSWGVVWASFPSLVFFITLPFLIRYGVRFGLAMSVSILIMLAGYLAYILVLNRFGVKI